MNAAKLAEMRVLVEAGFFAAARDDVVELLDAVSGLQAELDGEREKRRHQQERAVTYLNMAKAYDGENAEFQKENAALRELVGIAREYLAVIGADPEIESVQRASAFAVTAIDLALDELDPLEPEAGGPGRADVSDLIAASSIGDPVFRQLRDRAPASLDDAVRRTTTTPEEGSL